MKPIKIIIVVFLSLWAQLHAGIGAGNGGGGMYIDGQYKTFGELGIEIIRPGQFHDVFSTELQNEILDILNKFHISSRKINLISESIFENEIVYRAVQVVDPEKFEAVKAEYLSIFQDKTIFNRGEFKLYALTGKTEDTKQYTDIYPDFFNLNVRSQALTIIHEAFFRIFPQASLDQIVNVEKELNLQLEAFENDPENFSPVEFYSVLYDVGFLSLSELMGEYVAYLENISGEVTILSIISNDGRSYDESLETEMLYTDMKKVLKQDREFRGFSNIFLNRVFVTLDSSPSIFKILGISADAKLKYDLRGLYAVDKNGRKMRLSVVSSSDAKDDIKFLEAIIGDLEKENQIPFLEEEPWE